MTVNQELRKLNRLNWREKKRRMFISYLSYLEREYVHVKEHEK